MRFRFTQAVKLISACALSLALMPLASAQQTFVTIGSGSTTGLYYPTAVGMAKIINESDIGVRSNARSTGASVFNVGAIGDHKMEIGFAQNNVGYYAYNGTGIKAFDGKPIENLRGMVVLYPETIHVLVREDADINSIADFKGKRIYVGDIGSGTEQDVLNVLAAYDLGVNDLRAAVRGSAGKAVDLLRDGQIDAMFYTVGVGASAITEAAQTAPIKVLPIEQDKIEAIHEKFPFYTEFTIPAGSYPGVDNDVNTLTLGAALFVDEQLPQEAVYNIMQALFDTNIDAFYNDIQNPNLKKYFKLETALDGMPIPLHPGVVQFFEEKGIEVKPELKTQ